MILTREEALEQNFIIQSPNYSKKKEEAIRIDVYMLSCTKCGMFKTLEHFSNSKTCYKNKCVYCMECTKEKCRMYRELNKGKGSKSFKRNKIINEELVSFKAICLGTSWEVRYTIGNSFDWKKATEQIFTHIQDARNYIMTNDIKNKLHLEEV